MAWAYLAIAGILEIFWALGLKASEGFTRPLVSIVTVAAMAVSLALLGIAVRTLPVGTAYAVWTGIGTVGTAILGIVVFGDPVNAARIGAIAMIVGGIVGLKLL